MAESRLEMIFKNQMDRKIKISLDNPRADLTEAEVRAAMDDIVARNIFSSTGGDLIAVSGARVVTTNINELNV